MLSDIWHTTNTHGNVGHQTVAH